MRAIHTADVGGSPPVLVMTREHVIAHLGSVTVAPITSRVRGLPSEVAVGPANGLEQASVVNCDNLRTIDRSALGPRLGVLLPEQESDLAAAITAAFDLAD